MDSFIGVFDSGMGGLSVLGDLVKALPHENFVYIGDSAYAPYGTKTKRQIQERSITIAKDLYQEGAKAIVVACNTATSAAILTLRETLPIPVIGMEPALKPAALENHGGKIAVMATPYTLREDKFERLYNQFRNEVEVLKVPCPKLVSLVEEGHMDTPEVHAYLSTCFTAGKESIESIVLGCTHFLFIWQALEQFFDHHIKIYDGNLGTVHHLIHRLEKESYLEEKGEGQVIIRNTKGKEMTERSYFLYQKYIELLDGIR